MNDAGTAYENAIARYNAGDVDGFADAHAEDAILLTPAGTLTGRAAIREFWGNQRTAFPDLVLTVDVVVAQGDVVAAEWTWAGTNTGPVVLRGGARVPPTGRRVELKGMELAYLRGGKIAEYHMYWDSAAIAEQLADPEGHLIGRVQAE